MQSLVVAPFVIGLEHESSAKPGWETNPSVSVMPSWAESSLLSTPLLIQPALLASSTWLEVSCP